MWVMCGVVFGKLEIVVCRKVFGLGVFQFSNFLGGEMS